MVRYAEGILAADDLVPYGLNRGRAVAVDHLAWIVEPHGVLFMDILVVNPEPVQGFSGLLGGSQGNPLVPRAVVPAQGSVLRIHQGFVRGEGDHPAVSMIRVICLGLTIPGPRADAELSELPFTTRVLALIAVNSEAFGVTCPMISSEGNTSGNRVRGKPKKSKLRLMR